MSVRALARKNIEDTLAIAMQHDARHAAAIVADERCELAQLLLRVYRECLPEAHVILFDDASPDTAKAALTALAPGDLAILVQSSVFRIPDFRTRVELYR